MSKGAEWFWWMLSLPWAEHPELDSGNLLFKMFILCLFPEEVFPGQMGLGNPVCTMPFLMI